MRYGVMLRQADNSRHAGYLEVRNRIAGDADGPMLYATRNCHDGFWRTMPDLVMDSADTEDVDTDNEDHCYDDARYACMSRSWVSPGKEQKPKVDRWLRFEEKDEATWRTA